MNFHLFTSITLVVVAMMALEPPLTSGFALLSPLILRVNPSVIIDRMNKTPSSPAPSAGLSLTSCSKVSDEPATIISRPTAIVAADFGRDEELMRYKNELLSAVYEKALTRGFEWNEYYLAHWLGCEKIIIYVHNNTTHTYTEVQIEKSTLSLLYFIRQ